MSTTPSILYLHGFASGPGSTKAVAVRDWAAQRGIPTAIPDLNGKGFLTLTVASQLQLAQAALQRLPRPVVAVGSSLGGYLAALLADQGAELSGVLLLAPAFAFGERFAHMLGRDAVKLWREQGTLTVYHHSEHAEREVGVELLDDARDFKAFPSVDVPCTLVQGIHDVEVPVELARLYARDHPRVRLVEVTDDHTLAQSIPAVLQELQMLMATIGPTG